MSLAARLSICGALIAMMPAGGLARPPLLAFMNGTWSSDGGTIIIDTERMLANADTTRPFQRDSLRIYDMTGGMVTFGIGTRRFIGLFEGDVLTVTGGSLPGETVLRRAMPK